MKQDKEELKKQIVGEIIRAKGFKTVACNAIGLNPRTFRSWMAEDVEFRQAVDDAVEIAREYRDDVAEQKLFNQIEAGDTTAIIFYCKTRLKSRGYTERPQIQQEPKPQPQPQQIALPEPDIEVGKKVAADLQKKITAKKNYIVKLLKKQGKYTSELSLQVKITAQLLVRTEILAAQIFDENYQPINTEISREGNKRDSINPKDKLYLDLLQQSQKALRALGMNTDSRERKTDNDTLNDFLQQFKEEGEE